MGRIRARNTGPEIRFRSLLHRMGYRFTVNGPRNRSLPGRPDVVLSRFRTCFFVHGCFWHQHPGCRRATVPSSNVEYWEKKLTRNQLRDEQSSLELQKLGWRVVVVWECELADPDRVAERITEILRPQEEPDVYWAAAEDPKTYGKSRSKRSNREVSGKSSLTPGEADAEL